MDDVQRPAQTTPAVCALARTERSRAREVHGTCLRWAAVLMKRSCSSSSLTCGCVHGLQLEHRASAGRAFMRPSPPIRTRCGPRGEPARRLRPAHCSGDANAAAGRARTLDVTRSLARDCATPPAAGAETIPMTNSAAAAADMCSEGARRGCCTLAFSRSKRKVAAAKRENRTKSCWVSIGAELELRRTV